MAGLQETGGAFGGERVSGISDERLIYAAAAARNHNTYFHPGLGSHPTTTMSFSLSHPINTALLFYTLYILQRIVVPSTAVPRKPASEFKAGYSWMPRSHPPTLLFTTYTPRTLTKFDGKDGGRILLAIAGTVFDVTAGRGFYGPGKPPPPPKAREPS